MVTMRIVGIGDSVVQGKAATGEHGWLARLGDMLREDGVSIELLNKGIGADTIRKVEIRLRDDCLALAPDVVFLGVGVNDSRNRPSMGSSEVPIQEFQMALDRVVRAILTNTSTRLILVGQVPVIDELVDPYKPDKYYKRKLQQLYEHEIALIAEHYQLPYLENFNRWVDMGDAFVARHLADGLHPNDSGHIDLACNAYRHLGRSLLES